MHFVYICRAFVSFFFICGGLYIGLYLQTQGLNYGCICIDVIINIKYTGMCILDQRKYYILSSPV